MAALTKILPQRKRGITPGLVSYIICILYKMPKKTVLESNYFFYETEYINWKINIYYLFRNLDARLIRSFRNCFLPLHSLFTQN